MPTPIYTQLTPLWPAAPVALATVGQPGPPGAPGPMATVDGLTVAAALAAEVAGVPATRAAVLDGLGLTTVDGGTFF